MSDTVTKITGIILAAGTGSRMGRTKQLLPLDKTTLLGKVVENAKLSALNEIIIVLGYKAEQIQNQPSNKIDFSGTRIVLNSEYETGQGSSLSCGIKAVLPDCDGAMFLLADQPLITPEIMNILIHAWDKSDSPISIPYCNGKRGNPVIVDRSLFHRLINISGDTGARVLFKEYKSHIQKVEVNDNSILMDVDDKKDYEQLISTP